MKRKYQYIDYANSSDKRLVMTNYLRIGAFQQLSGHVVQGRKIYRRRIVLSVIAVTFLIMGLYGLFR
ncbi:MAG: hypothetical protein IKB25_09970 [Lentisphaeria bacterium]|nr:hypothetical protein [Lentisphaeria bacterium]